MSSHPVWILYKRELRAAFRERSIVVNSILLPIFLYPVVLWVILSGMTFVQGLAEGYVSRVAVFDGAVDHPALVDSVAARDDVEVTDAHASPDDARAAIRRGDLDAVLELLPAEGADARLAGNFTVRISFDGSETRSETARSRLESIAQTYREEWIGNRARALGVPEAEISGFAIRGESTTSDRETGAFILSQMIPVFLILMVALGCFVPAIDCTAGERERGTWETLMTVSAPRGSLVVAKYLYVATLGTLAGILNVLAMTASLGILVGPMLSDAAGGPSGVVVDFPPQAVPVMIVGALILALSFAALMMILAAFARTFKEGQSMVAPVYWLAMVPVFLDQSPDRGLTTESALVPMYNVVLMVRDAIRGIYPWLEILVSFGVSLVAVAACLLLARWILQFEEVLTGSYDGSFWRFIRKRVGS